MPSCYKVKTLYAQYQKIVFRKAGFRPGSIKICCHIHKIKADCIYEGNKRIFVSYKNVELISKRFCKQV